MAGEFDKELKIDIILNDKEVEKNLTTVSDGVVVIQEKVDQLEALWESWNAQIDATGERLNEVVDKLQQPSEENAFTNVEGALKSVGENFVRIKEQATQVTKTTTTTFNAVKTGAVASAVATNTLGASVSLTRTAFQALWATILANPLGILILAMSTIIPLYEFLSDLFEDTTQKEIDEAKALRDLTQAKLSNAEATRKVKQDTLDTLIAYDQIKKGTSDLEKGTDEYNEVMQDTSVILKNRVDENGNVQISQEELTDEIIDAREELSIYKKETYELNEELLIMSKRLNNLEFDALSEKFEYLRKSQEAWYKTMIKWTNPEAMMQSSFTDAVVKSIQTSLADSKTLDEAKAYRDQLISLSTEWYETGQITATVAKEMTDTVAEQFEKQKRLIRETTVESTDSAENLFKQVASRTDVANEHNLQKQLDFLEKAKLEINGVLSEDKSEILGFAPGLETEEDLNDVRKEIDKQIKEIEREIKARESAQNKKERLADQEKRRIEQERRDKLDEFRTNLSTAEDNLELQKISGDEFDKIHSQIAKDYADYVKQLDAERKKLTQQESAFNVKLKDSNDWSYKLRIEAFQKETDAREYEMEKRGEYSEEDLEFYNDSLERYKEFLRLKGQGTDEELAYYNYLIKKLRELHEARNETNINEPLQKELQQLELDTALQSGKTAGMTDPKKRREQELKDEEEYNKKRRDIIKRYADLSANAGVGEDEISKKKREELHTDLVIELANLEAEITGNEITEAERRVEATRKEWEEKFAIAQQTADLLGGIFNGIFNLEDEAVTKRVQRWLDAEMEMLYAEYDRAKGHAKTQRQQERLDEEYAEKAEKLKEEAEKKRYDELKGWFELEKAMNIASAIANTATGVTKAWAQGGAIFGPILAGIVAAAGAVQVATISAQEMPEAGFAEGGYTGGIDKKKIAGYVHGQEFVVNARATKKYRKQLEAMNAELPAYYDGGYVDSMGKLQMTGGVNFSQLENLLEKNNALLEKYLITPVPAVLDKHQAKRITQTGIQSIKRGVM